MSETPRTDSAATDRIGFYTCATVTADFARALERELNEAMKAYETVKNWAHRIDGNLNTILDRCSDEADGTSDATDLAKFANELVGLNNSLMLGDVQTLRQQRDQLRAEVERLKASEYQMALAKRVVRVHELTVERDQLRAEVDEVKTHSANWKSGWESMRSGKHEAEKERDQWRSVADQLAIAIKTANDHGYGLRIGNLAMDLYQTLKGGK